MNVLNLNLVTFGANQILLFTLFPVLTGKTSLTLSQLILSFSLGTLLFLVGSVFWSTLAEKTRPQLVLFWNVLFLFLSTVSIAVLLFIPLSKVPALLFLVGGRVLYGLGASGIPSVSQFLRLEGGDGKLRRLLGHSSALNLGRVLGPLLVLLPLDPKIVLLAMTGWLLVLLLLNIPEDRKVGFTPVFTFPVRMGSMSSALVLTLTFTLILGLLHSSLGQLLKERLAVSDVEASLMMARLLLLGAGVMFFIQALGRKFGDRHWRTFLLFGGAALGLGLLVLTHNHLVTGFYVGVALIFFGISLVQPATVLLSELAEGERGGRIGRLNSASTLGHALGGLGFLLFYDRIEVMGIGLAILLLFLCFRSVQGGCPCEQ